VQRVKVLNRIEDAACHTDVLEHLPTNTAGVLAVVFDQDVLKEAALLEVALGDRPSEVDDLTTPVLGWSDNRVDDGGFVFASRQQLDWWRALLVRNIKGRVENG
jgi:hypothetical protein